MLLPADAPPQREVASTGPSLSVTSFMSSQLTETGVLTSVRRLFAFFEDKTRNRDITTVGDPHQPRTLA